MKKKDQINWNGGESNKIKQKLHMFACVDNMFLGSQISVFVELGASFFKKKKNWNIIII